MTKQQSIASRYIKSEKVSLIVYCGCVSQLLALFCGVYSQIRYGRESTRPLLVNASHITRSSAKVFACINLQIAVSGLCQILSPLADSVDPNSICRQAAKTQASSPIRQLACAYHRIDDRGAVKRHPQIGFSFLLGVIILRLPMSLKQTYKILRFPQSEETPLGKTWLLDTWVDLTGQGTQVNHQMKHNGPENWSAWCRHFESIDDAIICFLTSRFWMLR